jgi:transcriptional regulator with XRE-family HTH domain
MTITTDGEAAALGRRVEARRKELEIRSMRQAAARAGFSPATWKRLAEGDPSVKDSTLVAAARALDMDPAEMFEWAGRHYTPPASSTDEALDELRAELRSIRDHVDEVLRRIGGE